MEGDGSPSGGGGATGWRPGSRVKSIMANRRASREHSRSPPPMEATPTNTAGDGDTSTSPSIAEFGETRRSFGETRREGSPMNATGTLRGTLRATLRNSLRGTMTTPDRDGVSSEDGGDSSPLDGEEVEDQEEGVDDGQAGAGASSDSGGQNRGWYPGKFIKRRVRKVMDRAVKPHKLEEVQRRRDGGKVVGRLRVTFKGTKGVQCFNPYFEVAFEGAKRIIKPQSFVDDYHEDKFSKAKEVDEFWGEKKELVFNITDITADIYIFLMDKRLRTFCMGKLILPLANFLGVKSPLKPKLLAFDLTPMEDTNPSKRMQQAKYIPLMSLLGPEGVLGQPPPSAGKVLLQVAIDVDYNLFQTYLASRPLATNSFVKRAASARADNPRDGLEQLDMKQLVINVFRLKQAIKSPPLLRVFFDYPVVFLVVYTHLCLTTQYWFYPLWSLALYLLNGWLAAGEKPERDITIWPKLLAEKIDKIKQTRAMSKIKRIKSIFKWLQDRFGDAATAIERSNNVANWSDPRVTLIVNLFLTIVATLISLVLYLVPFRFLVFSAGVAFYTIIYMRRNAIKLKKAAEPAPSPPPTDQEGKGKEGEEDDDEEEEEEIRIFDFEWADWIDPRRLLPNLVSNVFARTPDFMEVAHRQIATRSVVH